MKHLLLPLSLGLALFLLIYIPGKIRASGRNPVTFQSNPMQYEDYFLSPELLQSLRSSPSTADWLSEKGVLLPAEATTEISLDSLTIEAPADFHEQWIDWLDQNAPGQWQPARQELFNFAWRIRDRSYGLICFRGSRGLQSHEVISAVFVGYNERERQIFNAEFVGLSNQFLWYNGPAWPGLLILVLGPTLTTYILRRPLQRSASSLYHRLRRSPSSSATTS